MADEGKTDEFPFSEFANRLEHSISGLSVPIKQRGRNAFQHIRLAWRIRSIDPAMAVFRAITAEEEAATALILALQERRYPGAEKLDRNNHSHKAAINVLLRSIASLFSQLKLAPKFSLHDKDVPPHISMHFDIKALAGIAEGEPLFGESEFPLDFSVGDGGKNHDFSNELVEFAGKRGHQKILSFIKAEANLRNRVLYASDKGIPNIEMKDEFISIRKDRVLTILSIAIMILQTDQHQRFVKQCLNALLQALEKIEVTEVPFDGATPSDGPVLLVENIPGSKTLSIIENGKRSIVQSKFEDKLPFKIHFLEVWRIAISRIHVHFDVRLSNVTSSAQFDPPA